MSFPHPHRRASEAGTQAAEVGALLCLVLTCFPAESWAVRAPKTFCASYVPGWGARRRRGQESCCPQSISGLLCFACKCSVSFGKQEVLPKKAFK